MITVPVLYFEGDSPLFEDPGVYAYIPAYKETTPVFETFDLLEEYCYHFVANRTDFRFNLTFHYREGFST